MATTRIEARRQFWRTIGEFAPEVAATLKSDVFPEWLKISEAGQRNYPHRIAFTTHELAEHLYLFEGLREAGRFDNRSDEDVQAFAIAQWANWENAGCDPSPLDLAAAKWAYRWRLMERWCLEQADWTLHMWEDKPELASVCTWYPGNANSDSWMGEFNFEYQEPWRPEADTWKDYRAAVTRAFNRRMSEYRAATLADRHAYFIKPAPKHHYKWLVEYHFHRTNFSQIAKAHGRTGAHTTTVREAVQRLARFIELPLREAKRGRPKKMRAISQH